MSQRKPSAAEIEAITKFIINPLEEYGFHFLEAYKNKMSKVYLGWIHSIYSVLDKTPLTIHNKMIRGFYFTLFRYEFVIGGNQFLMYDFNRISNEGIKKYHNYIQELKEKQRQALIKRTKKILMEETKLPEDIINVIVGFY